MQPTVLSQRISLSLPAAVDSMVTVLFRTLARWLLPVMRCIEGALSRLAASDNDPDAEQAAKGARATDENRHGFVPPVMQLPALYAPRANVCHMADEPAITTLSCGAAACAGTTFTIAVRTRTAKIDFRLDIIFPLLWFVLLR